MTNYDEIARDDTLRRENFLNACTVIAGLYSDQTHFIYELLQNADDNESKSMELLLDEKGMVVWNDGYRFTEDDVRSICAIGSSNKNLTQIGTFGIGFKAVYSYTDCPEIYSGNECFRIHHFTNPVGIDEVPPEIAAHVDQGKTVFSLPFKEGLRPEDIAKLKNRLGNLKKESLLFLRQLKTVKWRDERNVQTGAYFCRRQPYNGIQNALKVELRASTNYDSQTSDTFLVFRKEIEPRPDVIKELLRKAKNEAERQRIQQSATKPQPVEIAFKLCDGRIVAVDNRVLFAYLPTEKGTHLRFLIQARYQTTPPRENIQFETPWNRWLVEETANFLPEVLEQLKVGGLLDPAFFNVLPLDQDYEGDETHPIFDPIAESLKVAMSERSLVPTQNEEYAKAKNVFYPHNKHLRTLIDSSCIYSDSSWLHPEIGDVEGFRRAFRAMCEAGVKEMKFSEVLNWLQEKPSCWFEEKPVEWLCSLYTYLNEQKSELERIKELPLVRLENGRHLCADNETVFFPPDRPEQRKQITPFLGELPILSSAVLELDEVERNRIEAFLKDLGVKPSRPENIVREGILPQYSQTDKAKPSIKQNRLHLGYLFEVRDEILREEPYGLKEVISQTPILLAYCEDCGDRRESSKFIPPGETYLSHAYTRNTDLETYFSVCDNVWFMDDGYLEGKSNPQKWIEFLKQIGAKDYPRFFQVRLYASEKECNYRGYERQYVLSHNDNSENHYISESCLDGVFTALDEVNNRQDVGFSKILWNLLVKAVSAEEQFKRDALFQSNYHWFYQRSRGKSRNALFYLRLKKYAWLPDAHGKFNPPSNCFDPRNREVLGDSVAYLCPDFDLSSEPARWLAEKLGVHLKADTEDVLSYLQALSLNDRQVYVKDVRRLYDFLADKDEPLVEIFKEGRLIFTPNPEPRWWRSHEVFWEDESAVFDNSRGYLKTHYGDELKSFFSGLDVSERASPLDYVLAVRDTASEDQASDKKLRERVKTLYKQLSVHLEADRFVNEPEKVEWEEVLNGKCWLGKQGSEWGFYFRHELVWNDHPQRAAFFEGKIAFWVFDDDLSYLAEYLEIAGCSQAKVEFHPLGEQIEDKERSAEVQHLYPFIHAFLKSPQLGNEKDPKPAEILTQLSICRVEGFTVTYRLKKESVYDPAYRPSFLDVTDGKGILWVGLGEAEDEYPELIGDALQDHFGSKELREFVKDLLLARNQHKTLDKWKLRGLDTNLCVSLPETKTEGNIEDSQDANDENLSSEPQSEDTNLEEDEPSIEDQTIVDTPRMSSGHENSSEDESEPQTPRPSTGGSRSGGGHWSSSSVGGGYGGHGGRGGGGKIDPTRN